MIIKEKSLCFTGHRSEKLPQTTAELETLRFTIGKEIDKAIAMGIDTFLMGACYGFDLLAANAVLLRRQALEGENNTTPAPHIKLIAAVPFKEQSDKWGASDRQLYSDILAKCDEIVTFSVHYKAGCYYERNRWLVDHSSRMICYYNGGKGGTGYTVAYAQKAGMPIINLFQKAK